MSSQPLLEEYHALDAETLPRRPIKTQLLIRSTLFWLLGPWVLGAGLALIIPISNHLPAPQSSISHFIGWVYFSAWAVSFYPQFWHNYKRKSTAGLSIDFQVLNLLGFLCYSIYNSALYFNPAVRKQYAVLHDGLYPAVHLNDVFFAVHAAIITVVTLIQCAIYDRGNSNTKTPLLSIIGSLFVAFIAAAWAAAILIIPTVDPDHCLHSHSCPPDAFFTWLTWLYFLSYIKLVITIIKYIPQVVLNYRLKSTEGWNVWNVLLDIEGGVLSLGQLLMDASICADWSPITGNPVKFALSWTSMLFDFVFIVQHYCLYADVRKERLFAVFQSDIERAILERNFNDDDDRNGPIVDFSNDEERVEKKFSNNLN